MGENLSLMDLQKYLEVIDQMGEVVFQADTAGCWTFLNAAWEKMTSFPVSESIGTCFDQYVYPEDREQCWQLFMPLVNREKEWCRHQLRYINPKGGFIWVEVNATSILNEKNEFIGVSGSIRDITEWRMLNHLKAENELWFKSLFNNAYQAMSMMSPEGKIIEANEQALAFWGLRHDEVKGKYFWEMFTEEIAVERQKEVLAKARLGKTIRYEVQVPKKGEGMVCFDCSVKPVRNEQDEVILLVGEARNITNLKNIEAELKRSLYKEKELNELKSRFISIASHQFRTPLAGIQSSLDIISLIFSKEPGGGGKVQKYLDRMQNDVSRMTALMNDVLMMEKITAGKVDVDVEQIDLLHLLNNMLDLYNDGDSTRQIKQYCSGTPRLVEVDQRLLWHILQNLLDNAIKYTLHADPPSLSVNFSEVVIIEIRDKGIGICEKELPHIFEPFFRAKNVSGIKGTGLGLTIVREFVELLGGTISVTSELNVGTTFTITLF